MWVVNDVDDDDDRWEQCKIIRIFFFKNGKKIANLTTKWTETKCVQKAPPTNFTNVWNPFPRFWLRPLIEKQNSGTVYHIGLNSTYVQYLLNFWNPHHIMIWRSPYLQEPPQKKKENYYTFFLKKEQEKKRKENPSLHKSSKTKNWWKCEWVWLPEWLDDPCA